MFYNWSRCGYDQTMKPAKDRQHDILSRWDHLGSATVGMLTSLQVAVAKATELSPTVIGELASKSCIFHQHFHDAAYSEPSKPNTFFRASIFRAGLLLRPQSGLWLSPNQAPIRQCLLSLWDNIRHPSHCRVIQRHWKHWRHCQQRCIKAHSKPQCYLSAPSSRALWKIRSNIGWVSLTIIYEVICGVCSTQRIPKECLRGNLSARLRLKALLWRLCPLHRSTWFKGTKKNILKILSAVRQHQLVRGTTVKVIRQSRAVSS